MLPDGRFDGRVVIVTGGAQGQGAAMVRRLVGEGAAVVVGDLAVDAGRALAEDLGPAAHFVRMDVAAPADWVAAVDAAGRLGPLRALINNAGIHRSCPIEEEALDELRRVVEVNLFGAFLGIQHVLEPMRRSGGGSIVNISSIAGTSAFRGHAAYGSSKWALRGLTRIAALELGEHGIRVNAIVPGPIATGMLGVDDRADRFAALPLGRAGEPAEVAALAAFLCSDEASYITGTDFTIDGGSTAGTNQRAGSPNSGAGG